MGAASANQDVIRKTPESMHQLEGSKKSVEEASACLWKSSHEKNIWNGLTRINPASKVDTEEGGNRKVINILNPIGHTTDEK